MSQALRLAVTSAALLSAYYALLFLLQRRLLYLPPPAPARVEGAEVVQLRSQAGATEALFLPPGTPRAEPAPMILFAHGNAELADDWIGAFDAPRQWGWAVLLLEYPGYGRSEGRPSESSIGAAALAAFDWAVGDRRVDGRRIVAYGRSLGGGVAARLAAERPVAAVVLESSFTSVRAFARRYLAPAFLVRDTFDAAAALSGYRRPVLVLHGRHDRVIPISEGRALASAATRGEFHELPCGHNDCPRPWPELRAFLATAGLSPGGAP